MKLNPYERREDIDLGIALIYRLFMQFFSKIVMTLVVTVIFIL